MKKFLLSILVCILALPVYAQDFSWLEDAPGKYLPSMTKVVVNRTSPCNQGEEAFMDFIPRFRKDKAFRNSRINLTGDNEMAKSLVDCFDNWSIMKAGKGIMQDSRYYATWYNVSADEVLFQYGDEPVDPYAEWGGSNLMARFQRIDGKWYLTDMVAAG